MDAVAPGERKFVQIATTAARELVPETIEYPAYERTTHWLYGLDDRGRVWYHQDGEWRRLAG